MGRSVSPSRSHRSRHRSRSRSPRRSHRRSRSPRYRDRRSRSPRRDRRSRSPRKSRSKSKERRNRSPTKSSKERSVSPKKVSRSQSPKASVDPNIAEVAAARAASISKKIASHFAVNDAPAVEVFKVPSSDISQSNDASINSLNIPSNSVLGDLEMDEMLRVSIEVLDRQERTRKIQEEKRLKSSEDDAIDEHKVKRGEELNTDIDTDWDMVLASKIRGVKEEANKKALEKLEQINAEMKLLEEIARLEQEVAEEEAALLDNDMKINSPIPKKPPSVTTEELDPLDAFMSTIEPPVAIPPIKPKPIIPINSPKKLVSTTLSTNAAPKFGTLNDVIDDEDVMVDYSDNPSMGFTDHIDQSWFEKTTLNADKSKLKKLMERVDHSKIDYEPFKKKFYIESFEISKMTDEEVDRYKLEDLEGVKIRGKNCPRPVKKWEQCGLPEKIFNVLKRHNYLNPFPIQCQAIPAIMSGRDIIACAKTGSGKTLAFVLPMLRQLMDQRPLESGEGPMALLLSPTRELATQIYAEIKRFTTVLGMRVVCVYGGASISEQIADLKRGAEIIVATPGRLIDMLCANNGRVTNLKRVTYVVLDEADRMFDMGFEPQIHVMLDHTRPDRQTVMFSATFPPLIEKLARKALTKPIEIIIGSRSTVSSTITQIIEVVGTADASSIKASVFGVAISEEAEAARDKEKFLRLLFYIGQFYEQGQILIFCDKQSKVDSLLKNLLDVGYNSIVLHGGMEQLDREDALVQFKKGDSNILIATSIAARGLDVKQLKLVVNYTAPNHFEDYVHRCGRTGRAGNKGTAVTLLTPEDDRLAPDLVKSLKSAGIAIPPELKALVASYEKKLAAGAVKFTYSGFHGSGFQFNYEEKKAIVDTRKKQKNEYGINLDQDDSDNEVEHFTLDEDGKTLVRDEGIRKMDDVHDLKTVGMLAGGIPISFPPIQGTQEYVRFVEKLRAIALEVIRQEPFIDTSKIYVYIKKMKDAATAVAKAEAAKGNMSNAEIEKAINDSAKFNHISQKEYASIQAQMVKMQVGLMDTGSGITSQMGLNQSGVKGAYFVTEIEINDFPGPVRARVSQRNNLSDICERWDVAIFSKGSYVAPGKKAPLGEKKMYLHIEGKEQRCVTEAKNELKRLIQDAAMESGGPVGRSGKYSL